jgi:hypothetical protein
MAGKNEKGESKTETAGGPIKRLVLQREKVRELKARTGVRTGQGLSVIVSFSGSTFEQSIKTGGGESNPPPPPTSIIFSGSGSW